MSIDLHIHSSYSDGAFTPSELVARARQRAVNVLAIADHDTVAGVHEAVAAGQANGIEVISAVELSVQFENVKDVHLLGYGIDCDDGVFLKSLSDFRNGRESRNDEIVIRVNSLLQDEGKLALSLAEVRRFACGAIGRPHIARALLERNYVRTVEEAFQRYLVPCNVPKMYWPIEEAINELHRIGGVAVLAHPTSITRDFKELRAIVGKLVDSGLDGIEVFNNMARPDEMEHLRRLAVESGLVITAGSDFHGLEDGLEIGTGREGISFDSELLRPLNDRIQFRRLQC